MAFRTAFAATCLLFAACNELPASDPRQLQFDEPVVNEQIIGAPVLDDGGHVVAALSRAPAGEFLVEIPFESASPTMAAQKVGTQTTGSQAVDAWFAAAPANWPPILLDHLIQVKGGPAYSGSRGFLFEWDGRLVGAAPAEGLEIVKSPRGLTAADFGGRIERWILAAGVKRISVTRVVTDPKLYGWILLEIDNAEARASGVQPLRVRRSALTSPGGSFFILLRENGLAKVVEGRAAALDSAIGATQPRGMLLEVQSSVNTTEHAGSPVVDDSGHLVGIVAARTRGIAPGKILVSVEGIGNLHTVLGPPK